MRESFRNFIVINLIGLLIFISYSYYIHSIYKSVNSEIFINNYSSVQKFDKKIIDEHYRILKEYYEKRKDWVTSNLGSILFKNVPPEIFKRNSTNKKYVILIWKYWDWLKKRHVYKDSENSRSSEKPAEILSYCSVNNCVISGDEHYLDTADAVVIHMQRNELPKVEKRNSKQRWIFLNDESPTHLFSLAKDTHPDISRFSGIFNWTMTYRSISDVPVPYGRTIPLLTPIGIDTKNTSDTLREIVPFWGEKEKSSKVIIMSSNCERSRMNFIHEMEKFIQVDLLGGCANKPELKNKCPGHFRKDCLVPRKYLFYLVAENSKCHEYITEKVFHNAYSKGAIPIIHGPPLEDCENLLPPNSFLHVNSYENLMELTYHIKEIARDELKILSLHLWRQHFAVVNEHGYFGTKSYHFCRVCEALNYNDENVKVYNGTDLDLFFDKNDLCDM